jgi:hypothetical protein
MEEWKPEQLFNGNYRRVSLSAQAPDPYPVLGATIPARIGIIAGTSGTLISIALSDLLNRCSCREGLKNPPPPPKSKAAPKPRAEPEKTKAPGKDGFTRVIQPTPGRSVLNIPWIRCSPSLARRPFSPPPNWGFRCRPSSFACFQAVRSR